jgi:hypothetical protein
MPRKASGHQPHGGIDAATKRPAKSDFVTERDTRTVTRYRSSGS